VTVVHIDPEGHARVQALLPWYVNGRLEDDERVAVESHLALCPRCRAELASERRLHAAGLEPEAAASAADRGWAALRRRVVTQVQGPAALGWRWVLGLQAALLALLAVALAASLIASRHDDAPYRALGNGGAGAANTVVMFSPDATEAQIRAALQACGGRFAGGPTATQAYLLALPAADAATLARLRAQPGVTLAESLATGGGQ